MAKVVSIINSKGGVGKTMTAVNLSTFLTLMGKRVLIYDLDPHSYALRALGILTRRFTQFDPMCEISFKEHLHECNRIKNLYTLAAPYLSAEIDHGGLEKFHSCLRKYRFTFDYIFLDLPPGFNLLHRAALIASTSSLIPVQCGAFADQSLEETVEDMLQVARQENSELKLSGIVLTMLCESIEHTLKVARNLFTRYQKHLFHSFIPYDPLIPQAAGAGKPLALYDLTSYGAFSYLEMAREFVSTEEIPLIQGGEEASVATYRRHKSSSRRNRVQPPQETEDKDSPSSREENREPLDSHSSKGASPSGSKVRRRPSSAELAPDTGETKPASSTTVQDPEDSQ